MTPLAEPAPIVRPVPPMADLLEEIRLRIDPRLEGVPGDDGGNVKAGVIDEFRHFLFETVYLEAFHDVAVARLAGGVPSGYAHWADCGRQEIVEHGRGLGHVPAAAEIRRWPTVAALMSETRALLEYVDDWGELIRAFSNGLRFVQNNPAGLSALPQPDSITSGRADLHPGNHPLRRKSRTRVTPLAEPAPIVRPVPPMADLLEEIRLRIDPRLEGVPGDDGGNVKAGVVDEFRHFLFETVYLEAFHDVAAACSAGRIPSGYAHWADYGRQEIVDHGRGLGRVPAAEEMRRWPIAAGLMPETRALLEYVDDWGELIRAFSNGLRFVPGTTAELPVTPQPDLAELPAAAVVASTSVQSVVTPGAERYYAVTPEIVAFYLPQYHRVRENDEWWGEGFTEWTNVRRARPNFEGHAQPRVPHAGNYYDLADPAVQRRQTKLAREYGIRAFCYYLYWFDGRRLLERPLDQMLADRSIDHEFCVCWANENWTRTWDGKVDDVLLGQVHTVESDRRFIRDALKYLADPRYLRIEGRLVLLVYRVDLLRDAPAAAQVWREEVQIAGLGELHLCAVQFYGVTDPAPWGFDAAVEFPPHGWLGRENLLSPQPTIINPAFKGYIFDYEKAIDFALRKPVPSYRWYRGVFPGWDNTARRQDTPHIFANAHPLSFERWLTEVLRQTVIMAPPEHQVVFVNAWNEWGEGAHLEPDEAGGLINLMALNSALRTAKEQAWVLGVLGRLRAAGDYAGRGADELRLLHHLRGHERALRALSERLQATGANSYL